MKIKECGAIENTYKIIHSQAKTDTENLSIEQLINRVHRGKIKDNMSSQRDADQMSPKNKTLIIHTAMINLYIPPIELVQRGTGAGAIQKLIDGKQRLSTFVQFFNNEFKLSKICPSIRMSRVKYTEELDENGEIVMIKPSPKSKKLVPSMVPVIGEDGECVEEEFDYKVAGKYFCQLPTEIQNQLRDYNSMPQTIHINYSEEEEQMQMLRSNMAVKMTPAQIGMVVCGEELATWLRSFRGHDLFKNNSSWNEKTQVRKSLIERCVIESYILTMFSEMWHNSYPDNVDNFKSNATKEYLQAFKGVMDDFNDVIRNFPTLREYLNKDNLHIIIAAYTNFCDLEQRYNKMDFGKFLVKWFDSIKDTTNYEVDGNTGTKQKTNVLTKLSIIDEECRKYMEQYGTAISVEEDSVDADTASTIGVQQDTTDAKTIFGSFVEEFGDKENVALASLALVDGRGEFGGDFSTKSLMSYKTAFMVDPDREVADRVLTIQDKLLSVQLSEDAPIMSEYNLPILIQLYDDSVGNYNTNVGTEVTEDDFLLWLLAFDNCEDITDVKWNGMTFDEMCDDNLNQRSYETINNKYRLLARSLGVYIENK